MNTDDTHNAANPNNPASDENNTDSANTPKYRVLGESGMVEDEDGNMYSVTEIYGPPEPVDTSSLFTSQSKFAGTSMYENKTSPAYWDYIYDPRYCGPSRSAYVEEMVRRYSNPNYQPPEQPHPVSQPAQKSTPSNPEPPPVPPHPVSQPPKVTEPPRPVSQPLKVTESPHPVSQPPKVTEPPRPVSDAIKEPSRPVSQPSRSSSHPVSEAVREKANREQKEIERLGLHPTYHDDFSYNRPGLNFVAIVDRHGTKIISNEEYVNVGNYYNGRARAQNRKTRKCGFVDMHGKEVIPCIWRSAGEFSEYLAAVQDEYRKCGYVDVNGKLVIQCIWEEAWPFHEGMARVQDGRKIGMINHRGKLVIPCVWDGMGDFSEGLAGVRDDNGKCGYMDKTGKVVIPFRWKNVWPFSEGLAVVQDFNKRLGFINKSGELVIPCRWKKVNYFKDGLAKVSASKTLFFRDKWVYIDKQGRIVK